MNEHDAVMADIDAILNRDHWAPRHGWHDDHRHLDRMPEYRPALQQVRSEFSELLSVIQRTGLNGGRCLQLGMGECEASHAVWRRVFRTVVTVDMGIIAVDTARFPGGNTHDEDTRVRVARHGPYDFLFIDAGHKFSDVAKDHRDYASMVCTGGLIAFHDAAKRPGYEDEIEVWRYLQGVEDVTLIGTEVGVAVIQKEG